MPGPKWKSHVQNKNAELDECRKRLDALINVAKDGDFEEHTERICKERTTNAVVEINIKTRRPSSSASKRHASREKHALDREAVSQERRADLASTKVSPKSKARPPSAKSGAVDVVDAASTSKAWKDRLAKEEESSQKLMREIEKLKLDLKSSEARCKAKDGEIEVLKDHVSRVMLSNNEMLTFLSQAREENGKLLHGLMIEKHKNLALAKNVARSEKESQRWKSLFGDFQSSLSRDEQNLRRGQPPSSATPSGQRPDEEHHLTDFALSEAEATATESDSAIEEGQSESHPLTDPIVAPATASAPGPAMYQASAPHPIASFAPKESSDFTSANVRTASSERLTEHAASSGGRTGEAASALRHDLMSALDKIRSEHKLSVTLPQLPEGPQRFQNSTINFDFTPTDLDLTSTSLTESRFRQGLETSLQLSFDTE